MASKSGRLRERSVGEYRGEDGYTSYMVGWGGNGRTCKGTFCTDLIASHEEALETYRRLEAEGLPFVTLLTIYPD